MKKSEMRKITTAAAAASTNTNHHMMKSASANTNDQYQYQYQYQTKEKGKRIDLSPLSSPFSNPTPNLRGNKLNHALSMDSDPREFHSSASGSKRGRKAQAQAQALSSPSPVAPSVTSSSSYKNQSSIADLRSLVDSRNRSLNVHLDLSYNNVTEEFDASLGRLSKRVKTQTKARLHLTDDIDNDYTRISDRIVDNSAHSRSSYKEFTRDTQAARPRVHVVPSANLAKSTGSTGKALKRTYTRF